MNLFNFNVPEWVFVIINFIVLVLIMKKVLWKPLNKILDERQAEIEKALELAQSVEEDRRAIDEQMATVKDELDNQTKEMMKEARSRAGREYDRIVSEAESRSKQIVTAARVQGEQERKNLMNTAKAEIISTALEMTGYLLETKMDEAENERLVESLLARKDVTA